MQALYLYSQPNENFKTLSRQISKINFLVCMRLLLRIPLLQKQTLKETLNSHAENEHLGTLFEVKLGR